MDNIFVVQHSRYFLVESDIQTLLWVKGWIYGHHGIFVEPVDVLLRILIKPVRGYGSRLVLILSFNLLLFDNWWHVDSLFHDCRGLFVNLDFFDICQSFQLDVFVRLALFPFLLEQPGSKETILFLVLFSVYSLLNDSLLILVLHLRKIIPLVCRLHGHIHEGSIMDPYLLLLVSLLNLFVDLSPDISILNVFHVLKELHPSLMGPLQLSCLLVSHSYVLLPIHFQ